MSRFKIGEKVICVNDKRKWFKLGGLKKNEMYTVIGFNPYDDGLILRETKSPKSGFNAYAANRFRKIDYDFVDRILQTIQPKKMYQSIQPKVRTSKKVRPLSFNFISLN